MNLQTQIVMLAQDEVLPPSAIDDLSATTSGAGATGGSGGSGGADVGGFPQSMVIIVVMVGALILFSMLSQRRQRKKRESLINSIKKHDKVQTVGGIVGSVVEVKPETVVLKVDESSNTRITFARSAIQQVLTQSASPTAVAEISVEN